MLAASEQLEQKFRQFKTERDKLPRDGSFKKHLKGLEIKYHFDPDTAVQLRHTFVDCADRLTGFNWQVHPTQDLAVIQLKGYNQLLYQDFAIFKKDTSHLKQGAFMCRLGFPFPEFTNYRYNEATDDIEWSNTGSALSPRFPIEGMVTRFLAGDNALVGIEMSTPGLKGQSGGPLFDKDGIVYGMQFSTKHLHTGFDIVDKAIIHNNSVKKVSDYSFIHLGQCVHADIIKAFLKEKQVKFYEA